MRTFSPGAWAVPSLPPEYDPWSRYAAARANPRESALPIERDPRRGEAAGRGPRSAPDLAPQTATVVPFPRAYRDTPGYAPPPRAPYSAAFLAQVIAQEVAPEQTIDDAFNQRASAAYEATALRTDTYLAINSTVEYRL